jgi:hypothetical protein
VKKSATRVFAVVATVALFSCAGVGQKRAEQEQTPKKPAVETAAVKDKGAEVKAERALDNPPKNRRELKKNIPAEYKGLVQVFDKYWGAREKKDYKGAYALESADFRKTTGFDVYKLGFSNDAAFRHVTALGVKKISEKEVIVTGVITLIANMEGLKDIAKSFYDDRWINEGGEWRHVPQTKKD